MPQLLFAEGGEGSLGGQHAAAERERGAAVRRGRELLPGWELRLPELAGFGGRIEAALARRQPSRAGAGSARRAAVAVVVGEGVDPALLFILRKERRDDPWSGQVAFPGGFAASDLEPPVRTACREALEETGLDLDRMGRYCGELDEISPRASVLPPLVVSPHVFAVPGRPPVAPGAEVQQALWVAVSDLLDPAHRIPLRIELPDGVFDVSAIRVGELTVWGLTERILAQLAGIVGLAD